MPTACITAVDEGRIIITHVHHPINGKPISLEIHRATSSGHDVRFIMLSCDEFQQLCRDIDEFAALPLPSEKTRNP